METKRLLASDPAALAEAVTVLNTGGVIAFPTDTVYGIGALVWDEEAVWRLYPTKARDARKPIPVLIGDLGQWPQVAAHIPPLARALADRFWPGPLTIVLPKHHRVPAIVTAGGPTVAVRWPNHPVTLALIRALDAPLAATSANRSGEPPPVDADQALAQLGNRIAAVLDGGRCPGGKASTVLDITTEPPTLVRPGPIGPDDWRDLIPTTRPAR